MTCLSTGRSTWADEEQINAIGNTMKHLLAIAAVAFTGALHAQSDAPGSAWSIGATGWYGGSYRSLLNTNGSGTADAIIETRDDR